MAGRRTGQARLEALIGIYPYLGNESHALNEMVQSVNTDLRSGADVEDKIDRVETECKVEEKTLAAAFSRFDPKKRGALSAHEMKLMCQYLGFPSEDADVRDFMKAIDADGGGSVSFDEFKDYVGKIGGSMRLFETRRARLEGATRSSSSADVDLASMNASLLESGIDQEAQASWRLVVGQSEFVAVDKLVKEQKNALATIRNLAKANHEKALPEVQRKVLAMRFTEMDLYMTLAWIRELAPMIVHVNLDKMLQFMESDTHYRNQFETGASGGLLNTEVRKKWEKDLFAGKYDRAEGKDRPKYGVQNVMNDYRGVMKCAQYGDSYFVLKDVRLRSTFSPEDSANLKSEKLAVPDFYAHVLKEYSDDELKETLMVANSKDGALLGDSDKVGKMKYKECQIHGEVCWSKHVERLVAHQRHRSAQGDRIKQVAKKWGWAFSWMDEEQKRMQAEDMHKLGGDAWKERLAAADDGEGDADVPEGTCKKKGCGRACAPGLTRAGKPYVTCCRGCIIGFGHDVMCGAIDASKVGPGLCKNGCGNRIAPGADSKGRALTTCCRGCALNLGTHDSYCNKDDGTGSFSIPLASRRSGASAAGDAKVPCKQGCGRSGTPGFTRSGKPFDTCCRGCVTGGAHDDTCDQRARAEGVIR